MGKKGDQIILTEDLGTHAYTEVWEYQQQLFKQNIEAKKNNLPTRNILLLCEHPHVITIGKNGKSENLLFSPEQLKEKDVEIFRTDRGGDITYHGPGQVVAYPVFDLDNFGIGLKQYIWMLEEIMICFLRKYNVSASRHQGAPGVWLDIEDKYKIRKIGAIGVHCSRYITMHGFALNVTTDLSYFSLINPCGFTDKGVTSLAKETGQTLDITEAKGNIQCLFKELFSSLKEK